LLLLLVLYVRCITCHATKNESFKALRACLLLHDYCNVPPCNKAVVCHDTSPEVNQVLLYMLILCFISERKIR
jgi:hypothetical protein